MACMTSPTEWAGGDDDLARQRRKREARLLDRPVVGFPTLTLADVVADVLALTESDRDLDVAGYLAVEGYGGPTIEAVMGFLDRQHLPDVAQSLPPARPSLP
jgi:hypothetical protein